MRSATTTLMEEPWYVQQYGPHFADLLTGVLSSFLGQTLTLDLLGGCVVSGTTGAVHPGVSVCLASPVVSQGALEPLQLSPDGSLTVPLSCLHAVRLPPTASVPRALADTARLLQAQQRPSGGGGRRREGGSGPGAGGGGAAAQPRAGGSRQPSTAPVAALGVSCALQGWGVSMRL